MFSISDDKSPGLDGFPAVFFKYYWDTIGPLVIAAISRFFSTGQLLREWNQTLIVLIPKKDPPEEVNHLRPISLCNVIYKCASKCLVTRMQPLLPGLIDNFQNAFVPGRQMSDNILLSHELIHTINKQRSGSRHLAALKIDMNKAYDRVHWHFLTRVLLAYGFPAPWVHLIYQCISTVSYRILINGAASKPFLPTCGLRQGDPLSPYLFLFCMDVLSRLTSLAVDIRKFTGIKSSRWTPAISHLFFADDAMFFFRASEEACSNLKQLLDRFCSISGQMINLEKSIIKFSPNIDTQSKQSYKDIFRMEAHASLGTYLGVNVDFNGSKVIHFTPLLDKMANQIGHWQNKGLSQASKLIIINSVLVASLINQLSIFQIPNTIAHKLDGMLARFFWSNSQNKGIHWRKQAILHQPKGLGGLGIRNISALNQALLMKQAWRIHQHPQLLLSRFYAPRRNSSGRPPTRRQKSSWGAKGLHTATQALFESCSWKVGNGRDICASSDKWVCGQTPVMNDNIELRVAASLRVADLINSASGGWDFRQLNRFFIPSSVRQISEIELPVSSSSPDKRIWPLTQSGNYSTKSGYAIALQFQQNDMCSMTDDQRVFCRTLWHLTIMPKWKMFIWKLWQNSLATSANLFRRGLLTSAECRICLDDDECNDHLFRQCPLAQDVWEASPMTRSLLSLQMSFRDWLPHVLVQICNQDGRAGSLLPTFIAILWAIWKTRNHQIFRNIRATMEVFKVFYANGLQEHSVFSEHSILTQGDDITNAPPPGFQRVIYGQFSNVDQDVLIRCDGAWDKSSHCGVAAWVADVCNSDYQVQDARVLRATTALQVEAQACRLGLLWAIQNAFTNVLIYTDSAALVNALRAPSTTPSYLQHSISDIRTLALSLHGCCLMKVGRDDVAAAHDMAQAMRNDLFPFAVH